MARSQLYLYTIVVLLLILFYFLSNLNTISQESEFYQHFYPQYGEIYKLEYGNYIYQNIINLYGSTLIPFTVYYNCSYNLLQIPNYFNSTHVIVIDEDFDFLPSYPSNNFVTFEIVNNYSISLSQNGYCIFNGYEVYNPNFNIDLQQSGNNYYQIIFYPQSIFTINKEYLGNLNNIFSTINFDYLNYYRCLSGKISSIYLQKILTGITINLLNISNANLNGSTIQVYISNGNICPINLEKIYYDVYNIPEFGTNLNTSSNNSIIYSGQNLIADYNYYNDTLYFCLESLGNEECILINNVPVQYYVPITIYNSQNISTPSPFQQLIYIPNNSNLYNYIDSNGQNVLFFNPNNGEIYYSWFEGNNGTGYIWWVNIPQGIPANSNITIYMGIGNSSNNYYQLYYPYVGASYNVLGTFQYNNIGYVMNPGLMYQVYYYPNTGILNFSILYQQPLTNNTCFNVSGDIYCSSTNPFIITSTTNQTVCYVTSGCSGYNVTAPYDLFNFWNGECYCGVGVPYPNPPVSNPSNSYYIKAIGWVLVPSSTTFYESVDDSMELLISNSLNAWSNNGAYWLGPIMPSSVSNVSGDNSASYTLSSGEYRIEIDYFQWGAPAYTGFWSNNPVYYYSPAFLPNGVMPSISIGNINNWPP